MTRLVLTFFPFAGCAPGDSGALEYLAGNNLVRANVSTPKEGKTVLRLRLYNHDGDSLTGSTVVTLSDCSVFSPKAWTCKDPDSEMYWTLEDETLSIVTPPNTSGITGVNMTLKRVHP